MSARRVYLDYNATSPVSAQVLEAVLPWLGGQFGNPSSIHWAGRGARAAVDKARGQVARLLGCAPSEIVFTASGSEADALALGGVLRAAPGEKRHLVVSAIEHPAVLNTAAALESEGVEVTLVPVGRNGRMDPARVEAAICPHTVAVSTMLVNNETGAIQPVAQIARIGRDRGVLVHCDAVQAVGRIPVGVDELGVDLLALSGHKIGAPQGVGALYVRRGVKLRSLVHGGNQERGRRAGTENVSGIVGLGVAAEMAAQDLGVLPARLAGLRDRLESDLRARIPRLEVNAEAERVGSTSSLTIAGVEGEAVLLNLDLEGIAASSGSACSSGTMKASHVLLAMGLSSTQAQGSLRFSLGRDSTEADVDAVVEALPPIVDRLRSMSRQRPTQARRAG